MRRKARLKHYYLPTPVKIRKIGDAMLGASTFAATTYALLLDGNKTVTAIMFIVGVAGKFISNLFKNEKHSHCDDPADEPGAQ